MNSSIQEACNKLQITPNYYITQIKQQVVIEDENPINRDYIVAEIQKHAGHFVFVDGVQRNLFILHIFHFASMDINDQ